MTATSKSNILSIAPELSTRADDLFTMVLSDVSNQCGTEFGGRQEEAQRYLAAHLLTLCGNSTSVYAGGASGAATKQKTGDIEMSFGSISQMLGSNATRYDLTVYGQRYITIRKSSIASFSVI